MWRLALVASGDHPTTLVLINTSAAALDIDTISLGLSNAQRGTMPN